MTNSQKTKKMEISIFADFQLFGIFNIDLLH